LVLGTIERTIGNTVAAVQALTEAYTLFAGIDHHYKAALAASALADATGDPAWTQKALGHSERYPGSPLSRTIAKPAPARTDDLFERLTPMQRQVARAMWEGLDARRLSERFSRSLYTIEREMNVVYGVFGTKSVAGLREIAMKRGLA
jgi:DNA-binding NarL/FixJ family response regulator